MYLLLIILFCNFSVLLSENKLTEFVKAYDIVDCHVSIPRTKRSVQKSLFDVEVRFRSHEIDFHLLLNEDESFKKLKIESYSPDNSARTENVNVKVFEGVADRDSLPTYVIGYLHMNLFTGSVKIDRTVYFVEPAQNYFHSSSLKNKIIVYREDDIRSLKNNILNAKPEEMSASDRNDKFVNDIINMLPRGINKTNNEKEDYACAIEIVSDHTLYEYFGGDIDTLSAYLYLHGKYSDLIFRRTDFDADGKHDRIRIITEKIFIYKSESGENYRKSQVSDINKFIEQFSRRTQNYCLSICMTHRKFVDSNLGIAYRASAADKGPPGGICQKPIPISPFSDEKRSVNTAVVTTLTARGNSLPMSLSFLVVAHELGHSFGSLHDTMDSLLCSPGGSKGFYLMHPKATDKVKPLSNLFSPCSKKTMAAVIRARGECLKPHPAVCGNAVREGDEECDCGKEVSCYHTDRCCTPSDAQPPERGCTVRRSKGAVCSPLEDKCCLNGCVINTDTKFECHDEDSLCMISYCDGENKSCPNPKTAPDRYPCRGTSRSCSGGVCNSSVCLDYSLKDCICKNITLECHICCEKAGMCVPAFSLYLKTPKGQPHYVLEGTSCNSERYQCDGFGSCLDPGKRKFSNPEKPVHWWAFVGLAFAILVILSVLIYISVRNILFKI